MDPISQKFGYQCAETLGVPHSSWNADVWSQEELLLEFASFHDIFFLELLTNFDHGVGIVTQVEPTETTFNTKLIVQQVKDQWVRNYILNNY